LWEPYIPKGKLTSIEGDPGVGKSFLTMALAAQISRGGKLPGMKHTASPAPVLLLTAEDGAADTIRPRLDGAGADVDKIHAITGLLSFDKAGAATLKREIERVQPAVVIIDPIVAYLPDKTDMNSASAVRPVLARLARVAEETGTAIAFVRHLAKATQNRAIYRGLGSIDFTAACRSVLMVGFDPNDAEKRVVAHGKSNLAAPGPSLAYTLKGGRFAWAGRSLLSAEDLGGPPPDADQRSAREEAREFLLQTLADGPRPQVGVQAEAAKIHISIASLRRAKGDLGVKASKASDHWEWSLPPRPERDGSDGSSEGAQPQGGEHLEHLEHLQEKY
jgi:KaiC/GvpD/RAD55 family RecA-like ATPase